MAHPNSRVGGAAAGLRRRCGAVLSALRRLWPRQCVSTACVPVRDLESVSPGEYTTRGSEPQLLLELRQPPLPGWYRAHGILRLGAGATATPRLCVDIGKGFDEQRVFWLPTSRRGVISHVFRLYEEACAIRLEPLGAVGPFALSRFCLVRISAIEAAMRLALRRLARVRRPRELFELGKKSLVAVRQGQLRAAVASLQAAHGPAEAPSYQRWIREYEHTKDADRGPSGAPLVEPHSKPRFSVLMPVYNVDPEWLQRAIESVQRQSYPYWELCIADDCSSRSGVRELLERVQRADTRIKLVFRERNGHIAACSNSALAMATGDFIVLMDHDDEIPSHALEVVAREISDHPNVALLYSDEDKIDEQGNRYDPYFKCDWNPDLFYSHNMISHLGVYRRSLVADVGGFRVGYEGSQDYDLALRIIERLQPDQIRHIPYVLYHWRSIRGSTALAASEKGYAQGAARRSLQDHFDRRGVHAQVVAAQDGSQFHRVKYALPAERPLVSLVIPTRDKVDLLQMCVQSILTRTDYPNIEIVIVDNQSTEARTHAYFATIKQDGRVRVLTYDEPFNFSAINNFGVHAARGAVIGFLNNDIEAIDGSWLGEMVSHVLRPEVGVVGAMLYYPDDTIQHAGVVLGVYGVAGHVFKQQPRGSPGYFGRATLLQGYSAVTAACCLVRREVFEEVTGLNEAFAVAFNDIDFCLRVRARGYRNIWTPYAELYHHESATRGSDLTPENRDRFMREIELMQALWGDALQNDPAYSPNLSLAAHDFSLAFPPRVPRETAMAVEPKAP